MHKPNRYLEAFKENFNVIGIATAAAAAMALVTPVPLLIGLVAEAVYLIFLPDSKWYEARLSSRYDGEIEKRREELKGKVLPSLRPDMRARFDRMEGMHRGIKAQQAEDTLRTASGWFPEVVRKLDFLLEKFLHFATKEVQFRTYLFTVLQEVRADGRTGSVADDLKGKPLRDKVNDNRKDQQWDKWIADELKQRRSPSRHQPAGSKPPGTAKVVAPPPPAAPVGQLQEVVDEIQKHYDAEMAGLRALFEAETDDGTKAVLEKRLEVIQRRRDFIGKIGKVLLNLNHQLLLLEDTFGLISDEIRAHPPEQVLADIEEVVTQTKTLTELLEEVAPFESGMKVVE